MNNLHGILLYGYIVIYSTNVLVKNLGYILSSSRNSTAANMHMCMCLVFSDKLKRYTYLAFWYILPKCPEKFCAPTNSLRKPLTAQSHQYLLNFSFIHVSCFLFESSLSSHEPELSEPEAPPATLLLKNESLLLCCVWQREGCGTGICLPASSCNKESPYLISTHKY